MARPRYTPAQVIARHRQLAAEAKAKAEARKAAEAASPTTPAIPMPPLIKPEHAAAFLGIGTSTLYKITARSEIAHVRVARRVVRYRLEDLQEFIERRRHPSTSTIIHSTDESLLGSKFSVTA